MKMLMWKYIKSNSNYLVLGITTIAFFTLLIFVMNHGFADPDGYYHARMGQLIVDGKIHDTFSWLPYTTLNQAFGDQHFLYHLLLTPFTSLAALPWSVVVFSTMAVLTFVWLLRQYRINPWLWTFLLVFGSADFLFRISLVKANTLSLVLLFLSLAALERKKYLLLLPVSFVFVWTYGGFVFLPLIIGAFVLVHIINEKKLLWQPIAYSTLGLILGFALHPQFPAIIPHLYYQIFQAGLGASQQIGVGVEWHSYQPLVLLKTNWPILAVWLASMVYVIRYYRKQYSATLVSLLIVSFCLFILMLKSQRFVEYWVPFALLFSAQVGKTYWRKIDWQHVRGLFLGSWQFPISVLVVVFLMAVITWSTLKQAHNYYNTAKPIALYQQASEWLVEHSNLGDIVFNPQWDQFPQLFYWDTKNYYIIGLDPTFMYLYNKDLYWKWRKISDDDPAQWQSSEEIYTIIKNDFHASYVFIENQRNPNLLQELAQDSKFNSVYSDSQTTVYALP